MGGSGEALGTSAKLTVCCEVRASEMCEARHGNSKDWPCRPRDAQTSSTLVSVSQVSLEQYEDNGSSIARSEKKGERESETGVPEESEEVSDAGVNVGEVDARAQSAGVAGVGVSSEVDAGVAGVTADDEGGEETLSREEEGAVARGEARGELSVEDADEAVSVCAAGVTAA